MDKKKYYKKGQANMAVGAIITLIVGVGVAVMVLIFVSALGGQTYNLVEPKIDAISGTVVNESFTGSLNVEVALANDAIDSTTVTVQVPGGLVNGSVQDVGNWSMAGWSGRLEILNSELDAVEANISYTFGSATVETSVKAGILSAFGALEQTGDYLPIIVLAVVISLVLGLVLSFTAVGGGGGQGTAL